MEIEAKFRVDDDLMFQRLARLDRIGDFRLTVDPRPENQHNVYFDTADGRLRSRRYGLRVRDLGDRRIATLKGGALVGNVLDALANTHWSAETGFYGDYQGPQVARFSSLTIAGGG